MRAFTLLLLFAGCGGFESLAGIDPGGAQDIGQARDVIERGNVPQAASITVEGLLSEHDVPVSGAPCASPICLRPAVAVAPSLETGRVERWVHLGLTSAISLDGFRRPPVDLVVAIDKSASMAIDIRETREAVARLIGHMRQDDRLAILAFDEEVHVLHPLGTVVDTAALQAQVRRIGAGGSWSIHEAIVESYARLPAASPERLRRVIVLSCSYPQIVPDGSDRTTPIVAARAREGIGITFVGVLLGWDRNLSDLLGKTAGANYYYLGDLERVEQVFDTDFDLIITPVAYDLSLALTPAPGWRLARIYGIPGDAAGEPAVQHQIATAFLSRNRGSIVARLEWIGSGPPPPAYASASLTYRLESALGLSPDEQSFEVASGDLAPDGTAFAGPGARKAVALINLAVRLAEACRVWHEGHHVDARLVIKELLAYLRFEGAALADPTFDAEIALVEKLQANMGSH